MYEKVSKVFRVLTTVGFIATVIFSIIWFLVTEDKTRYDCFLVGNIFVMSLANIGDAVLRMRRKNDSK